MRQWLELFETFDHPHARGEDEIFSAMFGQLRVNVDQCKRMIAAGEITPRTKEYSVKQVMESIYDIDHALFGSGQLEEPPGSFNISMKGPPVERKRLPHLPADKMNEPLYFIMLNSDEAMWLIGSSKKKPAPDAKQYPQMIDGNHRLMRRYIEGDEGMVPCDFINWEDAKKFTFDAQTGMSLSEIEAQKSPRP